MPLTCLQDCWIGLDCSLWSISEIISKCLERQESCVLGSMGFLGPQFHLRRWLWSRPGCCVLSICLSLWTWFRILWKYFFCYDSLLSLIYVVVLVAVILCTICLPPSITKAEVPHLSLKDPLMTAMDVPFLIPCDVCRWVSSFRLVRGLQWSEAVFTFVMLGMSVIPVVLTVCPEIYSALVRMLYSGGYCWLGLLARVKHLWLVSPCLRRRVHYGRYPVEDRC